MAVHGMAAPVRMTDESLSTNIMSVLSSSTSSLIIWRHRRRHNNIMPLLPLKKSDHPRKTSYYYRHNCYYEQEDTNWITGRHYSTINNYRSDTEHGRRRRQRRRRHDISMSFTSQNKHNNNILALLILLLSSTASIVVTHCHSSITTLFIPPTFLASRFGNHRYYAGKSCCCDNRASLFVSLQHPSSSSSSSSSVGRVIGSSHNHYGTNNGKTPHNDPDDHDCDDFMPLTFQSTELVQKLSSFSSNISRHRTARKKLILTSSSTDHREDDKDGIVSSKQAKSSEDDALIKACSSLVYFLRDETVMLSSLSSSSSSSSSTQFDKCILWDSTTLKSVKEVLEMVLIQAIRASSEVGDFVLLPKIVVAAVEYASNIAQISSDTTTATASLVQSTNMINPSIAILSPRIFGEAISSLSKTRASISKIKSLWNYFIYDVVGYSSTSKYPWILSSPPSSYELNAMLSSLKERGKISAAIKLYRQIVCDARDDIGGGLGGRRIKGDAYSASILFNMLAESISSSSRGRDAKSGDNGKNQETGVLEKSRNEKDGRGVEDDYISPCWQWNEAIELLKTFAPPELNNFAYTALLTVNERATEEYANSMDSISRRQHHDGVRCALLVLEKMKADMISPDVFTCSTIMATFDKGRNWKAAVALLNAMLKASSKLSTTSSTNKNIWSLPPPNSYTYSSVISTCARCNQGKLALSILGQMEEKVLSSKDTNNHISSTTAAAPNTWVYNAAIAACAESATSACATQSTARSKISMGEHLVTAFDILHRMERNRKNNESNGVSATALPDTVSYNTILSVLDESSFTTVKESLKIECETDGNSFNRLSKFNHISDVVNDILDTMEAQGIPRDSITYYNAIMACGSSSGSSENSLAILRRSYADRDFIRNNLISESIPSNSANGILEKPLKGRAVTGTVFVANAALSVAAKTGDVRCIPDILLMMSPVNAKLNAESMKHIIRTLGKVADCEAILALLICLRGQNFANDILKTRYSIDILSQTSENSLPLIEEGIYSAAITSCLRHDELGVADQILLSMKKNGLTLNQKSLIEIISEYCRMAMSSSKEEFKAARILKRQGNDDSQYGIVEPIYITSLARARAALTMLRAVENPPPSLLSPVAKACCAAGLWQDARSILRRMHRAAIRELRVGNNQDSSPTHFGEKFLDELPRLHRSLLKFCAKGGNITPALNFADDIQFLASQIRHHGKSLRGMAKTEDKEPELITISSRLLMGFSTPEVTLKNDCFESGSSTLERPFGLTGQDWKLILIAASRGGHWKVCVGTLPFIEPYVKETHPKYARETTAASSGGLDSSRPTLERLNRKYDRIARALTAAVLCFEARSQYAWAMRAIDDWIDWAGRRPRKEAVASACRILAKRYRGQEVLTLVTKVLNVPAIINDSDNLDGKSKISEYTYEKAIYTEAVNSLYKSGLYAEADQLYAEGVTNGHLPWPVMKGNDDEKLKLDLHGMSAAIAHSAVRVSLQKEILGSQSHDGISRTRDVLIITGRGRRSGEMFRPVLRPEVQRMLTEEFYPPLGTQSIPGNMGALLVSSEDIEGWLSHQQKQKGERLLFVADVLRDISSGNRLERALLKKFRQSGSDPVKNADETDN